MAVFGSASVSYCQAGKTSVWHMKTTGWIKQQLLSPWDSLLSVSLIKLHLPLRLEECAVISPLSSSQSPFLSVRGEFKFPRAVCCGCTLVQKYHETNVKPRVSWSDNLIGSLESTVSTNKQTALVSNCLCKPLLKAKSIKTNFCNSTSTCLI